MNWYVLYTKPKWEKKVADKLLEEGVVVFCPVITQWRQWSDRKKKVEVPLFSSYVFVQLEEQHRNLVFGVEGVVRYLYWLGKPAVVKNSEIKTIQKWLQRSDIFEVEVSAWQPGDEVVLDHGVFKDQPATVQKVTSKNYVLYLHALGCVLRVAKK